MAIHPYVQARLRALPRQDETTGLLLGSSTAGVTRVTGFKRAAPPAMRQVAVEAGSAFAGFYRLQTPGASTLRPEEEELLRVAHPTGRCLFLLVNAVEGKVEATAWTRDSSGKTAMETVSLDDDATRQLKRPRQPVLRVRVTDPVISSRTLSIAGLATAVAAAATYWAAVPPATPEFDLSLSLHANNGELVASWEQHRTPAARLQMATLSVIDGAVAKITDLTRTYSPRGQLTLRPQFSDIVVTLRVKYAGSPALSRAATYLGFSPPPVAAKPPPDPELGVIRKRNKELKDALDALRKHVF